MIAAVIALGGVAAVLVGVLVLMMRMQAAERRDWADERRALVDRAIAQHVNEVVRLDMAARPIKERPAETPPLRPVAEGL